MNKTEQISVVAEALGCYKSEVTKVYEALVDVIVHALADGKEVSIPGIGKIGTTKTKAREIQKFNTSEKITIPEHLKITFKPSSTLKEAVNK